MKKILTFIVVIVMIISVSSCGLKQQNDNDEAYINSETRLSGAEDSNKGSVAKEPTEIETKLNVIDETEKYLALENAEDTATTDEIPTTKVFDLNGEKINLTFKDKTYANKTWYQYNYTDESGIEYMFYEDEEFVGIFNPNQDYSNDTVISESEALEIAKDCALKLFPNEFEKYTLLESDLNTSLKTYTFVFYKNYGVDGCLKGEVCNVQVYAYGEINRCYMRNLYVFKSFDASLVENISQSDIDKLALELISKKYSDTTDWTITETSAALQYRSGNWVISLTVEAKNSKTEQTISEFGFYEIN